MDANPLEGLRRSKEGQYFLQREKELLEKLREHARRVSERSELTAATGVADEEVLRELQDLGYSPDTVGLFYLVPLLQVAWADGFVTASERELIVNLARTRDILDGTPADSQLQEWLRNRPSEQFFVRTNQIIGVLLTALAAGDRSESPDKLVALCTDVASASGGFLGFGKMSAAQKLAIEEVSAHLEGADPAAAARVVEENEEA